jgi:phospholipid/cholesterol/gamma-HCH transport system substrate-binding protein
MRRETINYTLVGGFVVLSMVLLLVSVYLIMGRAGPTDNYQIRYRYVTGLKVGTPVSFEGYQIGQVENIEPQRVGDDLGYLVDVSIVAGWKIPQDSLAVMTSTGLLSALSINIRQGSSKEYLRPGSSILGQEGGDVFKVINEVALDINDLANTSLRPLLDNLNDQFTRFSARLETDGGAVLSEVRALLARLDASATALQDMLGEQTQRDVRATVSNAREASANVLAVSRSAEDIAGGARQLIADARETRAHLDELVGDVDSMVAENRDDIRGSLQSLRRSLAIMAQRVDRVTYHLEGASRNMHEFSRQIRENPGLLLGSTPPADKAEAAE